MPPPCEFASCHPSSFWPTLSEKIWGDLGDEDKAANDRDSREGGRLMSRYDTGAGSSYVLTEWDRSATTVMLREDY